MQVSAAIRKILLDFTLSEITRQHHERTTHVVPAHWTGEESFPTLCSIILLWKYELPCSTILSKKQYFIKNMIMMTMTIITTTTTITIYDELCAPTGPSL